MQDSPNKLVKFRQSAFGRLIYNSEEVQKPFESYTLALLNCETSEDLYKSYSGLNSDKKKKKKTYFSINRSLIVPERNEIPVYWMRIEVSGWKPETRQETSLSEMNNKLILIGGISRSISKDVNLFNITAQTWQRLDHNGEVNEPRFGHSAVKYGQNIIVFGGGTNYDYKHKLRECLNGVHVLYTDSYKWEYIKTQGTYLPARKYHSAAMVGSHMFIYGGMNQKNNLLADAAVLNLKKSAWKSVDIMGKGPGKLAFHSSCLVLNPLPSSQESIYKFESASVKIKLPGIYFFGGLTSDKTASNALYLLKIGKRPLEWFVPFTMGKPPSPRFLHTMVFNSKLNLLIVFGGRVDISKTSAYTCFNDVFVLDLQSLIWLHVKVMGEIPLGRSGHASETADCRMFVFGGVTNTCYCSGDIWMLELDQSVVSSMGELYMKRLQHETAVEGYKLKSRGHTRSHTRSFSRSNTKKFSNFTTPDNFVEM